MSSYNFTFYSFPNDTLAIRLLNFVLYVTFDLTVFRQKLCLLDWFSERNI